MRIGIVGSREFPQTKLVEWFIRDLPAGVIIVSGGARGVDAAAEEYAKKYGLGFRAILPDLAGCNLRHEYTKKYYERNQKIVDDSDLIVAFTEKDTGGTWDTILKAKKSGKPVKIIRPAVLFPGESLGDRPDEIPQDPQPPEELPQGTEPATEEKEVSPQQAARSLNKGKGPFAIRRVSLGSYALRRKCYVPPEEWAEFVADKDANPEKLAAKMVPAFVDFFQKNKKLGAIDAITIPPRSVRNLGKVHVMELTGKAVAESLGVKFEILFSPWEKDKRGRHAQVGRIEVLPGVSRYVGKIVWVLDDVTTTNRTLGAAVQGLIALEIHSHGLAYLVFG